MHNRPAQTAIVTGAASGMGRSVVMALANAGLEVMAADLNLSAAAETARMATAAGGRAEALEVDVSSSSSVAGLFVRARRNMDRLDLFVHAAAVMGKTAVLEDITDEDWHALMAVNLDGAFFCCREAVRWMKTGGGGRIILFSSVAALQPTPGAIGYSAAKGAVNLLVRSLAVEAARHNIRVNAVAPGYVDTPMLNTLPEGFGDYIVKKTPLKRLGQVDEIAGLVAFLASREADFLTGQIISPNGGLVA
jgi:NAD(P)-dependent dehydrogenase (short-subunit alcohol dehydrogenase family)